MEFKDYYAILGVKPETPTEEIKRAYRKLARQYHPDVSKEPDAENRFKEINEAWQVLQDEQKRAQYDQVRTGGWQQQAQQQRGPRAHQQYQENHFSQDQSADFSEFFQSIFGGLGGEPGAEYIVRRQNFRGKGQDFHVKMKIPLQVAYQGGEQTLQFQLPSKETKSLKIKIPQGVQDGSQIRLKGQGGEGVGGGAAGDIYIEFEIEPHPFFTLNHKDVHIKLPITPWEAALGASIVVPTLGGNVNLKVAPNSQTGQKMRLKERGMPGTPAGDQYVTLEIHMPKVQSEEEKKLIQEMATKMAFNPRVGLGV
jgi:curved DNA-binding protein